MPGYVVRSRQAWFDQAAYAYEALASRAPAGATLADLSAVDHEQFCLLIEALVALGQDIAPELQAKAGLRPVDEVLGLP